MTSLNGKVALVTGAAGGIGGALVTGLRAAGVAVAVTDRDVAHIAAEARLPGDLLDPAYADGLPGEAARALGRLDIVVNNAGVITHGPVKGLTFHDLRRTAVTRLSIAGAKPQQIATLTGHSLGDVRSNLDRHYLRRDVTTAEEAIRKFESRTKPPN